MINRINESRYSSSTPVGFFDNETVSKIGRHTLGRIEAIAKVAIYTFGSIIQLAKLSAKLLTALSIVGIIYLKDYSIENTSKVFALHVHLLGAAFRDILAGAEKRTSRSIQSLNYIKNACFISGIQEERLADELKQVSFRDWFRVFDKQDH